jgi:trans-aconitate methyltransferase
MTNFLMRAVARWIPLAGFKNSQDYWKQRYKLGGDSGVGSMGEAASHKASVLNAFVVHQKVSSIIEFGCGDGRQLELAKYPEYLGVDISQDAISQCRKRFLGDHTKSFKISQDFAFETSDLTLSIDVIFHLVEDATYDSYLAQLFAASTRFVVLYSSDVETSVGNFQHVRHRAVSRDIERRFPDFVRMKEMEHSFPPPVAFNRGVPTKFLVYQRNSTN